jgi:hypothetical protein
MRLKSVMMGVIGLAMLAGCAPSTTFVNTWTAPDAKPFAFKKVLVIALVPNEQMRRSAEDQIVGLVKNTTAVASYSFLSTEQMKDPDYAKAKVAEMGFDGAVILAYQGTEKESEYVPGGAYASPYYQPFWGYYGYASPMMYDPGYMTTYNLVKIETTIYSLPDQKMLWAGMSQTEDPGSLQSLVDSVAQGAATKLRQQGLVK